MSTNGAAAETGQVLEQERRFSESILWQINRQYFIDSGPEAWHSGTVPSYATCNTYIAQAYAHVVLAYLRDALAARLIDPAAPVYIVELAAGVGRFAYQFLRKLHALLPTSSLRRLDVRYAMTDFTLSNVRAWRQHPSLAPFAAAGRLAFGTFDVDRDAEVKIDGDRAIAAATNKNPLVVLGNYAFDTFRTDLFRVADGALNEVLVTVRSPRANPDLARTEVIQELKLQFTPRRLTAPYYDDPVLNRVLDHYKAALPEAQVALPVGGFVGLRRLIEIGGGRLLLLTSDKGFTHEDELYHPTPFNMQFHGGCFSMMVNYHAIGRFFTEQGGLYLPTSGRAMNLKTAACILGGDEGQFADTVTTFRERIDTFGPSDFFELFQAERTDCRSMSVPHFLCLLKLSHFDPSVVMEYAGPVMNQAGTLAEPLQIELRLALERAWENFFPGKQDLPFEIARIFMALRRPLDALRYCRHSLDIYGDKPATYVNMGVSQYYAERPLDALRSLDRALELSPSFSMARAWRARIQAELERAGAPAPASP